MITKSKIDQARKAMRMAKTLSKEKESDDGIYFTEEEVLETEEYFQTATKKNCIVKNSTSRPINSKSTNSKDDGVTIGVLSNENQESEEKFFSILSEAIDETLTSLGEPVKNAVYSNLQSKFKMSKDEIPERISEFSDIIHKIFGSGACRLEIKFMKAISSRVDFETEWPKQDPALSKWILSDVTFPEFVYNLRMNYCAKVGQAALLRAK
jgi:hypothetical protein